MNKKLLKTVATIASASMVMLSTANCFAAIGTTTTAAYDFSTGKVKVTTVTDDVTKDTMVTYLVSKTDTVAAGSDIIYIDQKTAGATGTVEFAYTADIDDVEGITSYLKMGSNGADGFTTDDEDLNALSATSDNDVVTVRAAYKDEDGNFTVIARVKNADAATNYGATLKDIATGKSVDLYAVKADNSTNADADDLTSGYYAISVKLDGVTDYTGYTLTPFVNK